MGYTRHRDSSPTTSAAAGARKLAPRVLFFLGTFFLQAATAQQQQRQQQQQQQLGAPSGYLEDPNAWIEDLRRAADAVAGPRVRRAVNDLYAPSFNSNNGIDDADYNNNNNNNNNNNGNGNGPTLFSPGSSPSFSSSGGGTSIIHITTITRLNSSVLSFTTNKKRAFPSVKPLS